MMKELDDLLKHYGVKGMKWGVVRNRNRPGGADGKDNGSGGKKKKARPRLDSLKRERQWKKVVKEIDKLTTNEINDVTRRVRLENDLKRLSKSSVGRKKDRQDYLNRAKMSDHELNRKVVRLRAKDNLHKSVKDASREQRELARKIIQVGGAMGMRYAVSRTAPMPRDVLSTINNPKDSFNRSRNDLQADILNKLERKSGKAKS